MPKILFRADAEKSIGIGDLMSVIYLSHEFRKNRWECFFAVKDYASASKIIERNKIGNVYLIPCNSTLNDEVREIKKICKDISVDCLFMEITERKLSDYKILGRPTPIKACVNFDGVITDDFDVISNWCVDLSDNLYAGHKNEKKIFILGFENTVLPHYFDWHKINNRIFSKDIRKIIITMGGADEFNLGKKVVKALSKCSNSRDYEIRFIIGPAHDRKKKKDLYGAIGKSKFKKFTIYENKNDLFEDYLWADMAFSAGGLSASELVASKTPSLILASKEHQIKRCKYYSQKGWAHYVGYRDKINEKEIIKGLNYMLENKGLFQETLGNLKFKGGNEKIYESINSCRQSRQLV